MLIAQKGKYTLTAEYDNDSLDPREDYDNFGKMFCWHRRYNLGDKHDYKEPEDFLRDILFKKYSSYPNSQYGKPVYDYIKRGYAKDVKIEYNKSTHEWELLENQHWSSENDFYVVSSYSANCGKEVPDWFLDDTLNVLNLEDLFNLVRGMKGMVILPLYLLDHSGITISTSDFNDRWDSGQVGWIYADTDMIKKEYGEITPKTIKKAQKLLDAEVETYDCYLRGECYGYRIYENHEETDSCWGFIMPSNDFLKTLKDELSKEYQELIGKLQNYDSSVEDFWKSNAA